MPSVDQSYRLLAAEYVRDQDRNNWILQADRMDRFELSDIRAVLAGPRGLSSANSSKGGSMRESPRHRLPSTTIRPVLSCDASPRD